MFSILVGNTDDHARNHAAFLGWSSAHPHPRLRYLPQDRAGNEATQAMLIMRDDRMSRIMSAVNAAPRFQLSRQQALVSTGTEVSAKVGV
ncbi:HipA-like C-terminal domain-containing protein [Pelagibacterium luteolum]|uniref:HipA-like C-terminal domain-containing protein n=1 Tax=Pelagibacterium luteolum TaxID=440168 RepID=A0A1G7XUN9_9HYPH|nr:HipA-like C-terminal domain-containing protein [Pelagibacterium luteolum]